MFVVDRPFDPSFIPGDTQATQINLRRCRIDHHDALRPGTGKCGRISATFKIDRAHRKPMLPISLSREREELLTGRSGTTGALSPRIATVRGDSELNFFQPRLHRRIDVIRDTKCSISAKNRLWAGRCLGKCAEGTSPEQK
jgi:hypothetical protein